MQLNLLAINVFLTLNESHRRCHCLTATHTSAIVNMSTMKTDVRSAKIGGARRRLYPISTKELERKTSGRENVGVGKTTGHDRRFVAGLCGLSPVPV
jgi:hypothetical protein